MEHILEELWFGNIRPNSDYYPDTEETRKLMGYVAAHHDKLMETLSEEQKQIFIKFDNRSSELTAINELELFKYAFGLGAKLMIEVMSLDLPM